MHAFSDASEKAYGSCLYLRCSDQGNNTSVALICAKSRVAPLKKVTLPRLELCAAVLMTELVQRVIPTLNINIDKLFYWTDSSIVLSWIGESSSNWCTFVANRVAIIQENTDTQSWYHIDGKDNPADCVSRGMLPMDLFNCTNWFKGPSFLQAPETKWPFKNLSRHNSTLPERRKQKCVLIATDEKDIIQTFKFCNSFLKLQGVFGVLLRFCKNAQVPTSLRLYGPLRVHEREDALKAMVIVTQRSTFKDEYSNLSRKKPVNKHSRLKNLNPFLDNKGIIRVGGRLENADLQYDAKHPMVLPSSHEFTRSLFDYYHIKHMHAGPQALLAILRQRFWPLNGRTAARKVVHSCIRCFRAKPRFIDQIMGNLPSQRIQPARPFLNSGVTRLKIRGKTPSKTYIAIFICFATKAVHLEVASDLSTSAFIAALKRFIGRRGFCENLYCDNATNFVGANAKLKQLRDMFTSEHYKTEIIDMCAKDNITFHFIPPRSPHFGGLWEAAVKSVKHHLRRTICGHSLTFEDLNTAVIQIEAILNSRPITEMSSDPNDLKALTPGHFLIGEPLTAIVEPGISEQPQNRIQHWQKLQHIQQTFWKRWSKDYLSQLQIRTKWKDASRDVTPGDLTLIKDDDLPPMKWMLGRVIQIHPGADGRARVATIKTANGNVKRAISKLCPLPTDSK